MAEETIPNAKELLGDASTQVFINQLLLTMVLREGGRVAVSVTEIDNTGGFMLNLKVDPLKKYVILEVERKQ